MPICHFFPSGRNQESLFLDTRIPPEIVRGQNEKSTEVDRTFPQTLDFGMIDGSNSRGRSNRYLGDLSTVSRWSAAWCFREARLEGLSRLLVITDRK